MEKTGYFRITDRSGNERYTAYSDVLSYPPGYMMELKKREENGEIRLSCGCRDDRLLELMVTKNGVLRVKNNLKQAEHRQSCPKSVLYAAWIAKNGKGIYETQDRNVVLNIALPSAFPDHKDKDDDENEGKKPKSGHKSDEKNDPVKRTALFETVRAITSIAWEKQIFSKKKEIRKAVEEGRTARWSYKNADEFRNLVFGVSNDITAHVLGENIPFSALLYKKEEFFSSGDPQMRRFVYAEIMKVSEIKKERKYQYITVRMPSDKSRYKAVVRVRTQDYEKMEKLTPETEGLKRYLAGYVKRSLFKQDDYVSDWITLLQGVMVYVSDCGLPVKSREEAEAVHRFANARMLFLRPYLPFEDYGNLLPSFYIARKREKDLIIDIAESDSDYKKRSEHAVNNRFYEVLLYMPGQIDYEEIGKAYMKK